MTIDKVDHSLSHAESERTKQLNELVSKVQEQGIENSAPELGSLLQMLSNFFGSICYRYKNAFSYSFEYEDAISACKQALIKACKTWEPKQAACFTSHLHWWCEAYIREGIEAGRTVHVPDRVRYDLARRVKAGEDLSLLSKSTRHGAGFNAQNVASLDIDTSEDTEDSVLDNLRSDEDVEQAVLDRVTGNTVHSLEVLDALSELNQTERAIVIAKFGFDDGSPKGTKEVAEQLGLTTSNVDVAWHRAKKKLEGKLASLVVHGVRRPTA